MNWHHWYWWTWPAGIAIGLAWSFVLMCLIPPRRTVRDYIRGWKDLFLWPAQYRSRVISPPPTEREGEAK